jgi:hypothetical protein
MYLYQVVCCRLRAVEIYDRCTFILLPWSRTEVHACDAGQEKTTIVPGRYTVRSFKFKIVGVFKVDVLRRRSVLCCSGRRVSSVLVGLGAA